MKTAEIEVGKDYAYGQGRYCTPQRVKVIETGVGRKTGYGYSRSTKHDGVLVEFSDGKQRTVASREIARPWDAQEAINTASKQAAEARDRANAEAVKRRCETAFEVDQALRSIGVPTRQVFLGRTDEKRWNGYPGLRDLRAAGFEVEVVHPEHERHPQASVVTAITGFGAAINSGEYSEHDARLLAQAV